MKKLLSVTAALLCTALALTSCVSARTQAPSAAGGAVYRPTAADGGKRESTVSGRVVVDSVEVLFYSGGSPYLHEVITNGANRTITGYTRGMLAFDKVGQPVSLQWYGCDVSSEESYLYEYEEDLFPLAAGKTEDGEGGWSLPDELVLPGKKHKVAYGLYCYKELTFSDGTVWKNPQYAAWLETYEGKATAVATLEGYYPLVHEIG